MGTLQPNSCYSVLQPSLFRRLILGKEGSLLGAAGPEVSTCYTLEEPGPNTQTSHGLGVQRQKVRFELPKTSQLSSSSV